MKRNYYFTFNNNSRYSNYYVIISSESYDEATEIMTERHGCSWLHQFTNQQWVMNKNNSGPYWDEWAKLYNLDPEKTYSRDKIFNLELLEYYVDGNWVKEPKF